MYIVYNMLYNIYYIKSFITHNNIKTIARILNLFMKIWSKIIC